MSSALYASNVFHYDHVLAAMEKTFDQVALARRLEVDSTQVEALRLARVPKRLTNYIDRRTREQSAIPSKITGLGSMQIVTPIATKLGIKLGPGVQRSIIASAAKKVSAAARDKDVLHFVEGLGHHALAHNRQRLSICEVRNFHYKAFRDPVDLLGGFPLNSGPEALSEILDYEYQNADAVVVYSETVRQSFISRDHDPRKVHVAPLGIGPQLPRTLREREKYTLIFVGRGDPSKGLDVAVATLRQLGAPFRLKVAGPMTKEVKEWLTKQPRVEYLGILSRLELRDLYSTAGAMILPSVESFGLAAAEAVYHRLPLVCSDTTGISGYLPSGMTTVVLGRNPAAWANSVLETISADKVWSTKEVDSAFESLTWDRAAGRLTELYRSLCTEHGIQTL